MPSGRWAASKLPAKLPCDFEVFGCFFAAVYHNIERDVLTFGQCRQSGAFDGGNVDEHIQAKRSPAIKLGNDNRVGGAGLTSTSPGRSWSENYFDFRVSGGMRHEKLFGTAGADARGAAEARNCPEPARRRRDTL